MANFIYRPKEKTQSKMRGLRDVVKEYGKKQRVQEFKVDRRLKNNSLRGGDF